MTEQTSPVPSKAHAPSPLDIPARTAASQAGPTPAGHASWRRSPPGSTDTQVAPALGAPHRKHSAAGAARRRRPGRSRPRPRPGRTPRPRSGSPARRPSCWPSSGSASRWSSAFPAVPCCPPTTRCSTPSRSATSWSATSRAPGTPRPATPRPPGRTGVCMATSGPGATNLVTPLADAYMDSVPVVAITGQVSTSLIGTDGFQEADISGITYPVTKHNFLVTKAGRHRPHHRRGLPPGRHRAAGPGAGGHRQGRDAGDDRVQLAGPVRPARLPPGHPAALPPGARGGEDDHRGQAAGALRRRRRDQGRRLRASCGTGRADRRPGRHHADGARRVPRQPPAPPGHARHARHGRRGRRAAAGGPASWPSAPGSTTG